uniref:Ig-like domain-containing protein n=1 Tax=Salarias fasciatus TaxID=181472 RepID=A0A672GAD6_SALFA
MATPTIALFFLCFLGTDMIHLTALKLALKFETADVGQTVTLKCNCQIKEMLLCYWFKQSLGEKPKLLSTFFSHKDTGNLEKEFIEDSRFALDVGSYKNDLAISDLRISDSATYFCVASNLYNFEFCEGITVSVQDSGLPIETSIYQSVSGTNQTRDSVMLNCMVHTRGCDQEHRVYWFKSSGDSHPGLIYTHGDGSDQCDRTPSTQPHTCIYNLPMKSLSQPHAGTYYCAVIACGRIVFGNGTTLDFNGEAESSTLVYFLGTALALTTILIVSLAFAVYKLCKRLHCAAVRREDGETLHYAAVEKFKGKTSKRKSTTSECVYSTIKQ